MKRICVYCGSAVGASSVYVQMAEKLAIELVKRNIELVYGGAQGGVMGSIANSVLAAGGSVIGVLPVGLFRTEVPQTVSSSDVGKMLGYLDHAVAEKFIRLQHREMIVVDADIESMFEKFSQYEPPIGQKWVDLERNYSEGD